MLHVAKLRFTYILIRDLHHFRMSGNLVQRAPVKQLAKPRCKADVISRARQLSLQAAGDNQRARFWELHLQYMINEVSPKNALSRETARVLVKVDYQWCPRTASISSHIFSQHLHIGSAFRFMLRGHLNSKVPISRSWRLQLHIRMNCHHNLKLRITRGNLLPSVQRCL